MRRAPRGARGLKPTLPSRQQGPSRRAPRGARGLKHAMDLPREGVKPSRPARGAWIETLEFAPLAAIELVAPRAGRVD